jgi:hypothetical protein
VKLGAGSQLQDFFKKLEEIMISMFRAENSTEQEAVELVRKYF